MTPAEIITEISKLPPGGWDEIKKTVDQHRSNGAENVEITEDEVNRILFAEGIIGNIPDLSKWTDEDENWEPVEIAGRPTSEIIIEDRG